MSALGVPTAMVRVMSVVPSSYWPPESMRKSSPGCDAAVALAADAVMHDGAVGAGAGDGRKRNVLEQTGVAAKALQRFDRVDLGQSSARRFAIEPGEEARHGDAVTLLRRARAGDLGGILDRLHRRDRVAAAQQFAAVVGDQARDRLGTHCRIEPHRALCFTERDEIALEIVVGADIGDVLRGGAGHRCRACGRRYRAPADLPSARWRRRAPPAYAARRCRGC